MAQFTGYICDRRGCDHTDTGGEGGGLPEGWLTVNISTKSADVQEPRSWQMCSNRCAAILFIERTEADTNKKFNRGRDKEQQ